MPINSSSIGSAPATSQDVAFVIELLQARPTVGVQFTPTRPPGQLVGYYNGATDTVELYVVNANGNRFYRAG